MVTDPPTHKHTHTLYPNPNPNATRSRSPPKSNGFFRVLCVNFSPNFAKNQSSSFCAILLTNKKTNEKALIETQVHCALAVVRRSQKFSPRRRPLPGGAGRPKFYQLEMVTTFTYKPSLVRIDARNFELS